MGFRDDIREFNLQVETDEIRTFVRTVEMTRDSIVEGSAMTGAPGQPVGQYGPGYHPGKVGGNLKASWQVERTQIFVTTPVTTRVVIPRRWSVSWSGVRKKPL